jgi:2-dehydropantoate 2-reductase
MLPYLSPDAIILSLQNGVENAETLQGILPQRVIPAVVYVATEMAGPGHLKHHGRGELAIGDSPVSEQLAAKCTEAGVPVQVSTNIMGILWGKLIVNCAYNALSAIAQQPYGKLVEVPGVRELMHTVVSECLAVAKAAGVQVPGDSYEIVRQVSTNMATQYSSTAQDVARGKPNEIDYLNGYVCRQGALLGIPTPVNQTLLTLVKLISTK